MGSRHDRIDVIRSGGCVRLNLEGMEIWDGADLALIRDTLTAVLEDGTVRSIVMDMSTVKYIPSGFFGMLCDWSEKGVGIRLTQPQENVAEMLWFQTFFHETDDGSFELRPAVANDLPLNDDELDDCEESLEAMRG